MLKIRNTTTKQGFEKQSFQIKKIGEGKDQWQINDMYNKQFLLSYDRINDEYCISHEPYFIEDDSFSVTIASNKDMFEIRKAVKNGRELKSDKFLKRFVGLGLLVNCCTRFGYLK